MFGERAHAVGEIAQKRFEPGERAAFAIGLARLLRAAEADESLAARFGCCEAGADAVFGVEGDVALEFGGKIGFGVAGSEEAAQANEKRALILRIEAP
jgi:hypothetical protein